MLKKIFATLVFSTVLFLPFLAQAATWERAFEMKVAITSPDYSLSSGSVRVSTFSKQNIDWKSVMPTEFYITLYDKNGKSYGRKTQDRFADDSSTWSVPSSQTYYFYWSKANDGSTLKGSATITN